MIALKITTDCKIKKIDIQEPLYQTVKASLGGPLEILHPESFPSSFCMITAKEAIGKESSLNPVACYLYQADIYENPIVGDVIVMRKKMTENGIALIGLKEQEINTLTRSFNSVIAMIQQNMQLQEAL